MKRKNFIGFLDQRSILFGLAGLLLSFFTLSAFAQPSFSKPITIAVLDSSLSAEDRSAIAKTLEDLREALPDFKFEVRYYHPSELEEQLKLKTIDYFIGTSGFYRRFQNMGLSGVATLFTESSPNPRYATGAVFVVKSESPIQSIKELKGKTAIASWSNGFSSYYAPMGEIYRQGFDPEKFFGNYRAFGPPMSGLLQKLDEGVGDVVLMRACVLEDMAKTNPSVMQKYRVLDAKKDGYIRCLHSTQLYPNWTFVATSSANWEITSDFIRALLNIPITEGFGWAVVPDFNNIDNLYRSLKLGPYSYLRIQSLRDFVYHYRFAILFFIFCILALCVHAWRTNVLVRRRTHALHIAYQKEADLRKRIRDSEKRLEQLQKTEIIGAMSALLAHEINTPLATIDNYCRGIKRRLENQPDEGKWLETPLRMIGKQTARISEIVSKVRSYAKKDDPEMEPIDVKGALEEFIKNVKLRRSEVIIDVERIDNAVILGHLFEFEVLVENVLINAIDGAKACGENHLSFSEEAGDHEILVRVKNPTDVRSAEELEARMTPLKSSKKNGMGFGLLICRTIAEKMRGNLKINYEDGFVVTEINLLKETGSFDQEEKAACSSES